MRLRYVAVLLLGMGAQDVHAAGFPLKVSVSPATMPYNAHPVLVASAPRGAICTATVVYSTGRRPVSFHGVTITSSGVARWGWHEETKGTGGTAWVACTYRGTTERKAAGFVVTHR